MVLRRLPGDLPLTVEHADLSGDAKPQRYSADPPSTGRAACP